MLPEAGVDSNGIGIWRRASSPNCRGTHHPQPPTPCTSYIPADCRPLIEASSANTSVVAPVPCTTIDRCGTQPGGVNPRRTNSRNLAHRLNPDVFPVFKKQIQFQRDFNLPHPIHINTSIDHLPDQKSIDKVSRHVRRPLISNSAPDGKIEPPVTFRITSVIPGARSEYRNCANDRGLRVDMPSQTAWIPGNC